MLNDVYQLKSELIKQKKPGIALDIDETLSWTIGWWVEKMQEIFGNPEKLTVPQLIKKYRYTNNVPYWQSEEALKWMEDQRTSNSLQEQLPLIADANKIANEINKRIPIVAYITTRPDSVISGTYAWLEKHGFPKAPVIARPRYVEASKGNMWKADVLNYLYPQVAGIIDDNPGLVDHMSAEYKGTIYLYDNTEHARTDIKVVPCANWQEVKEKIKIVE